LPSSTTSGRERNSGSVRNSASTGRSGTKMQAKGIFDLRFLIVD
jgi:hypothetical protein